jgi:hypothetical protein
MGQLGPLFNLLIYWFALYTPYFWNHIINIYTFYKLGNMFSEIIITIDIFGNERVFNDLGNNNLLQAILVTLQNMLHVIIQI